VERHDFERLREGEFLNDNLIGFYLRFLEHHLERTNPEASKRTYFFNSYFFATLTNTPKGKRGINYEGVQKWTRNVDLFSHDYVVVPINESAHWYLAIICNLPSLERKEGESEDQAPPHVNKDVLSRSVSEAKEEIPETPPETHGEGPAEVAEVAEQLPLESNTEETTRESFASMTLSEAAPADGSVSKEHPPELDDDWPEKEENPTSSPPKFSSSRGVSRSTDPHEVEQAVEQSEGGVSRETTEQKRETRSPSRKDGCRQPTIITFDSLGVTRSPTIRVLRTYLLEEAMSKRSLQIDPKRIRGMKAREIPLQPNFSDCGLYLLAYLEKFAQDPDLFVEKLLKKEMQADRDWPRMKSGLLRRRLRDFLYKLQEEQENIRSNKTSSGKMLVDEKPISFILGSAEQPREDHAVPASGNEEVKEELEKEQIKSPVPAKIDVSKPVPVTRSTSHKPDETSQSQTGDIDAAHAEHEKSINPVEEKKYQPEVVTVEPETDCPETARPKTPETGRPTADELERDTTEVPKNRPSDRELRSSPRRARKPKTEEQNAPRHQTPDNNDDNKWVDDLWEMTGSPKRVKVEVQVPGTPPSSSRSGTVRQSPRSSPRQVKSRNKKA
jgi:sentrin-specific protease 7